MAELPHFDYKAPVRLVAISSLRKLHRLLLASVIIQSVTLTIQIYNLLTR